MPALILGVLAQVLRWLLSGFLGKLILSVLFQGVVIAASLFYSGAMAEWVTNKMVIFVKNSQFWERLSQAFTSLILIFTFFDYYSFALINNITI